MGFPSAAQPNNRTALRWGYLIQINFGAVWSLVDHGEIYEPAADPGDFDISTAPLFAQAQQPNAAELAQKVVSIISGHKAAPAA